MSEFRQDVLTHVRGSGCRGVLVDTKRASLVLDNDIVDFDMPESIDPQDRMCPVALVVSPANETLARLWAWEMANYGFIRGAFTDAAEAWLWLRSCAGVLPERLVQVE